jgi:hypothetical protein
VTEQQPPSKAETFIMTISFERTLMRDGRALLALPVAEEHLERVLVACASLMFATALEQGIRKRLIIASQGGISENALCHVSEEYLSFIQDESTLPNAFLQRLMSKMEGLYIWAEVTRTDAQRFEQAVDQYLEDLVNHPPTMVLTGGDLWCRARTHTVASPAMASPTLS